MVTATQILLILVALVQAIGMMTVLIYNYRNIPRSTPDAADSPIDSPADTIDTGDTSRPTRPQRRPNQRNH